MITARMGMKVANARIQEFAQWFAGMYEDLGNLWKQWQTFDDRCSILQSNRSALAADAGRLALGMLGCWLLLRLLAMDLRVSRHVLGHTRTIKNHVASERNNAGKECTECRLALPFGLIAWLGIHWECSCSPSLIRSSASPATSHENHTCSVLRILDFGPYPQTFKISARNGQLQRLKKSHKQSTLPVSTLRIKRGRKQTLDKLLPDDSAMFWYLDIQGPQTSCR